MALACNVLPKCRLSSQFLASQSSPALSLDLSKGKTGLIAVAYAAGGQALVAVLHSAFDRQSEAGGSHCQLS